MAKLVRRHTSNVEIISSNLVGSIYFFLGVYMLQIKAQAALQYQDTLFF